MSASASGARSEECKIEGPLTWCEDGVVEVTETKHPADLATARGAGHALTYREELMGSVRWDADGTRWRVKSIDDAAWVSAHHAYNESVAALGKDYADAIDGRVDVSWLDLPTYEEDGVEKPADVGGGGVRNTGTAVICGAGLGISEDPDFIYYSSYNVTAVDDPMNVRERKVVYIESFNAANSRTGTCSGTLVDNDTVLTAAHCLWNYSFGAGAATGASFRVCDFGNAAANASPDNFSAITCATASTATVPFGYKLFGDFGSDYAVLELPSPMSNGFMAMWDTSTNGTTAILSHDTYTVGFPGVAGIGCGWPTATTPLKTTGSGTVSGANGYKSANTTLSCTSGLLKTEISSSPGQSGSPFYFYPYNGLTTHYISGVLDGWHPTDASTCPTCTPEWTGGPNVGAFRSWVISNM